MTSLRTMPAAPLLHAAVGPSELDATLGPDDAGPRLAELAARVADAATSPLLAVLLGWLRHTPAALAEVAARSYWHHNGFAKIVLHTAADPDGRKLRLHVWPAGDGTAGPRGESDPHGHRWEFASSVLVGGFDVVEYDVVEQDGVHYGGYTYDPTDGLRGGIEVILRARPTVVRPRGDVYRCDTSVLHTVEPQGSDVAATLVAQGPVVLGSTWVYRREPMQYTPPVPLRPDEVAHLVGLVLERL